MIDKIMIMNQARLKKKARYDKSIINKASKLFNKYKKDPLFIAGIMLYWAEGRNSKSQNSLLEISNSNPKLLKIFCDFLRKFLDLNGKVIKARLFLYPDLDAKKTTAFWSRILNIPISNFIQPHHFDIYAQTSKKKLAYGVCNVYIYSKDMRLTIDKWIDCFTITRR